MRVLVIRPGPNFSVADVCRGWVKGLRDNGVTVADFNLDDRLNFYAMAHGVGQDGNASRLLDDDGVVRLALRGVTAACYEFQPDVVVVVSCFYLPADLLDLMRVRGSKVVLLHTESPYEDDRQVMRAAHADLNVVNDPTNLDRFPPGSIYLPHAYDPEIHYPREPKADLASDFAFVGTGYPSRLRFLEAVDWAGIDVALAGNWGGLDADSPLRPFLAHDPDDCIDNTDAVDLYSATKASANLYRTEAERPELSAGWAMGPREVELAATGCFYMTQPRGENREVLPMVPTFDTPEEFSHLLRWWLTHDDARQAVADKARCAVADRTFTNNAARLLSALDS